MWQSRVPRQLTAAVSGVVGPETIMKEPEEQLAMVKSLSII